MKRQIITGSGIARWAAAALLCGAITATVRAQVYQNPNSNPNRNPNQGPNQGLNQNQNQNPNQNPNQGQTPPSQPPANGPGSQKAAADHQKLIQKDEADIAAAQKDLADANQGLQAVVEQYRVKFQQSDLWLGAQKKLTDAKASLATAHQAVLDNIAKTSDYQDAVAEKKKAQSDLAAAKLADDASPQTLTPLAQAVLAAATKVSKMENDALDDDTDVKAWKAEVATAQSDLKQLDGQFLQKISYQKDYKSAKDGVDAARKKVMDAQAKLQADSQS